MLSMDRNLTGKKPTFAKSGPKNNPYRVLLWVVLIVALGWFVTQVGIGPEHRFQPAFMPTPTPTRSATSYLMEADARFNAGVVSDAEKVDAIESYQQALELEPENATAWAELARLLTYSSSLLPTQGEKIERMAEARQAVEQAVALAPDDSTVNAVNALVLDWSASVSTDPDQAQRWLVQAEQAAGKAYNEDPENYLAPREPLLRTLRPTRLPRARTTRDNPLSHRAIGLPGRRGSSPHPRRRVAAGVALAVPRFSPWTPDFIALRGVVVSPW